MKLPGTKEVSLPDTKETSSGSFPNRGHFSPVHTLWPYAFNIHFNIIFPFLKRSLSIFQSKFYMHKYSESSVLASKDTGLEVNADKTKYMVMSRDQNAGWSHSINIDNSSFERVEQFNYLGTTLMNKNPIQVEIYVRADWRRGMFSIILYRIFCLPIFLSKYIRIKIYRTSILHVVLYVCETWSLTLRERSGWGCLRIGRWGEYLGLRGTG